MNDKDFDPAGEACSLLITHFGGGDINLPTASERDAFAKGRIETATQLVETCVAALDPDNRSIRNSLTLAVNLLLEASEALTKRLDTRHRHPLDTVV